MNCLAIFMMSLQPSAGFRGCRLRKPSRDGLTGSAAVVANVDRVGVAISKTVFWKLELCAFCTPSVFEPVDGLGLMMATLPAAPAADDAAPHAAAVDR